MLWYHYLPGWQIVTLPFFLLLAFFAALGTGLYIAALNVKYRDFRFLIPFIAQLGLYISPVGFSTTIVPENYRVLYYLNPMVGVIDGFRWAISGGRTAFNATELLFSIVMIVLLCVVGVYHFRKTEKTFADVI
jgi:lipopolysaccharide transport system permease protein